MIIFNYMKMKKTYLLGLDIRQNFVRLTALSYCNARYQIEACEYSQLHGCEITEVATITLIKKLLSKISFKIKDVALALAHSEVVFKEVKVDSGLSAEEIGDFLQFNLAEQNFDYYPVGGEAKSGESEKTVRLVAARGELIERGLKLLRAVGLKPKIIDVDIYALERAARWQLKNISGLVAIINIDYGNILLTVIDHKKVVYVHEDDVEEENLNSIVRIIEQLDLKLQLIHSVILQSLECVVLGGEKAGLPGLLEEANSRLNVTVIIANPFFDMTLSPLLVPDLVRELAPLMLISSGLALRVANDG